MTQILTYTEKLPCGAKLNVTNQGWAIEYSFWGADSLQTQPAVRIPEAEVSQYIEAWWSNWLEYQQILLWGATGVELEKPGKAEMVIRVGGSYPGVALRRYYLALGTRSQIGRVMASYQYALLRGFTVQQFLIHLPRSL